MLAGELCIERAEPFDRGGDGEVGDGGDVGLGDLDRKRFGLFAQPCDQIAQAIVSEDVPMRSQRKPMSSQSSSWAGAW